MAMKRKRGRPPTDDADRPIAALAEALQIVGMSERRALDLAIALIEGQEVPASKMPRGGGKRGDEVLIGYRLRHATFSGRASGIRNKLAHGTLQLDPAAVLALAALLLRARPVISTR
jgi:hypothetical protein